MFVELIGKTIEVYVDNMLVKRLKAIDHVMHLDTVFQMLRKYKIRLNFLKFASESFLKSSWVIWLTKEG